MNKTTFTICEYQSFVCEREDLEKFGYISIDELTFHNLENFILSQSRNSVDPIDIMGISARKNVGKLLTAKNYVGIISMKNGTTIEILPKIATVEDHLRIKKIFIEMIQTLHNFPCKNFQTSKLDTSKLDIFEIFVRMFIDELYRVLKGGLRSNYNLTQENLSVCKGKIKFKDQLRKNMVHKERFYVEYNVFNLNRAENRLIKTALALLLKISRSAENKRDLMVLINNYFSEIPTSINYKKDLSAISKDRNMKDYTRLMQWCEIFITGHSFTSFSGSNISLALLFPMDFLFEQYVANQIKKIADSDLNVSVQDRGCYLFENRRTFALRPDIVITRKTNGAQFILDTKWKLLADKQPNYGISQMDMYQMYAYCKKYSLAQNATLLYPDTTEILQKNNIEYKSEDEATVKIFFIDLLHAQNSINHLLHNLD